MQAIDACTPIKAAGLAVVLSAANPKNLVLAVGGAVSIAGGTASASAKFVAGVLFVLIASLCTAVPWRSISPGASGPLPCCSRGRPGWPRTTARS